MSGRDITPALGTPGEPAEWRRAAEDAPVAYSRPGFEDAARSLIFGPDTGYASEQPEPGEVAEASRRMRTAAPRAVHGPLMKAPVWKWEVPLYFWFGGIAAGSSFMALGCDLAGDPGSARIARVVALTAVAPCPPLLIADLGRPERFLHMLRVFKPRSPMSSGAWCLTLFGHLGAGAVAADVLARPRTARALGAANALVGGYLGSYTGVLLGSTAVPVWARSRLFLGPLFVATATATGAAATRLTVSARGLEAGHPTDVALGRIETAAMSCELLLAIVNERRLGPLRRHVAEGRSGAWFHAAKSAVRLGTVVRYASRGGRRPRLRHAASVLYLAAGLAFRWAWVTAGRASAQDSELVAAAARGRHG